MLYFFVQVTTIMCTKCYGYPWTTGEIITKNDVPVFLNQCNKIKKLVFPVLRPAGYSERCCVTSHSRPHRRFVWRSAYLQVRKVREVARAAGVDSRGSKLDIIHRLQQTLKNTSIFRKVFSTLWGSSGITLLFSYTICYSDCHETVLETTITATSTRTATYTVMLVLQGILTAVMPRYDSVHFMQRMLYINRQRHCGRCGH